MVIYIILNLSSYIYIYRDKYPILLKEIIEVLYNIFLYKGLYFLYLFNKVLFYAIL